jgi:hypothetical protein
VCVIQQNTKINTLTTNDHKNKANTVSRPENLLHLDAFVSDDEIMKLVWYVCRNKGLIAFNNDLF